ncbi:hypothetical protein RF11_06262 [Thelohanellus kitauei]|uniref:Uncharacterized protein n=1 Tax=Thelohanellus kitauei TaxID=669202 RepID=A0A0C2MNX8_THEKT|nr:hypothetical protein RF11_06262 [Thelohanellus kitauei]
MNSDLMLCVAANSKGEVVVGANGRIGVIVDDLFRKHHVFHLKSTFNSCKEITIDPTDPETKQELTWTPRAIICSKSSHLFAALINDRFVVLWRRLLGSDKVCDNWEIDRIIG